jgi:glycine cleavage system regulatory protein
MNTSVVLSVVSEDRPGVVEALSELLDSHGGNWTESSMLSLAGLFAGILLAELPREQLSAFRKQLASLESRGIQVLLREASSAGAVGKTRELVLDLVGQDRPGIVHDVSRILARHSLNVQELETTCQSASMSAENLFMAHARLLVPEGVSVDQLRRELEDLADELMVDINLGGASGPESA